MLATQSLEDSPRAKKRRIKRRSTCGKSNILNAIRKLARISKFLCFHETRQTQNEVERFFYIQLDRICFRILSRQSENFSVFCKVLSQIAFRNMIVPLSYRYPWLIRAIQRALALPSLSHTCFMTRQFFTNPSPDSLFLLRILSRPFSARRQNVASLCLKRFSKGKDFVKICWSMTYFRIRYLARLSVHKNRVYSRLCAPAKRSRV